VNLPNSITLARIGCVPLFLWVLAGGHLFGPLGHPEPAAALIFLLASITDGVDGVLARRLHQVTTVGTLLSPLADKLLVSTAYIALARFAPAMVPAWIAVLIVGREFLVTGLASVAAQEQMHLQIGEFGKLKTIVQSAGVLAVLMAHYSPVWSIAGVRLPAVTLAVIAVWVALVFSLFSAAHHLRAFLVEAMHRPAVRNPGAAAAPTRPGVSAL
jgi:CDP-diacylglycerol--glycerol-3-phosphate 3-phosphatidyltransferase